MTLPDHVGAFLRGVDAIAGSTYRRALPHSRGVRVRPAALEEEGAFVGHEGMRGFLDDTARPSRRTSPRTRNCTTSGITACSRSARYGCAAVSAAATPVLSAAIVDSGRRCTATRKTRARQLALNKADLRP